MRKEKALEKSSAFFALADTSCMWDLFHNRGMSIYQQ